MLPGRTVTKKAAKGHNPQNQFKPPPRNADKRSGDLRHGNFTNQSVRTGGASRRARALCGKRAVCNARHGWRATERKSGGANRRVQCSRTATHHGRIPRKRGARCGKSHRLAAPQDEQGVSGFSYVTCDSRPPLTFLLPFPFAPLATPPRWRSCWSRPCGKIPRLFAHRHFSWRSSPATNRDPPNDPCTGPRRV